MSSSIREQVPETLCGLIYRAAGERMLEKAVFSRCHDRSVVRRTLTLRQVRGEVVLQLETLRTAQVAEVKGKDKPVQASQENLPLTGDVRERLMTLIGASDQVNLFTTAGSCEYRRSRGGQEILLGAAPLLDALNGQAPGEPKRLIVGGNDRKKNHILSGAEPFLIRLGISDGQGRVHDKKQPKFRQINHFLELIRDAESCLPEDGPLGICDLCCGKSYLSFAVYHYFTAIRHRQVRMVGVDMKAEVMDDCNAIARELGMDGLSFVCADVSLYEFGGAKDCPDMVISLHACDTATDRVLDRAISWGARLILSTPCCHHEMMRRLDCPALDFIAGHSMLKQKLCDAATDALRLKRLEAAGYEVAALELIDPEETPKNVMLRGIRRYDPASARCRKAAEAYAAAERFLLGGGAPCSKD